MWVNVGLCGCMYDICSAIVNAQLKLLQCGNGAVKDRNAIYWKATTLVHIHESTMYVCVPGTLSIGWKGKCLPMPTLQATGKGTRNPKGEV